MGTLSRSKKDSDTSAQAAALEQQRRQSADELSHAKHVAAASAANEARARVAGDEALAQLHQLADELRHEKQVNASIVENEASIRAAWDEERENLVAKLQEQDQMLTLSRSRKDADASAHETELDQQRRRSLGIVADLEHKLAALRECEEAARTELSIERAHKTDRTERANDMLRQESIDVRSVADASAAELERSRTALIRASSEAAVARTEAAEAAAEAERTKAENKHHATMRAEAMAEMQRFASEAYEARAEAAVATAELRTSQATLATVHEYYPSATFATRQHERTLLPPARVPLPRSMPERVRRARAREFYETCLDERRRLSRRAKSPAAAMPRTASCGSVGF